MSLIRQGDECATRIIGIGFASQQTQFDTLRHETGRARLINADGVTDRTDAKGPSRLGKRDEQPQLRSPTEVTPELRAPIVLVLMLTVIAVVTVLAKG